MSEAPDNKTSFLMKPVDNSTLVLFRILFGVLMFIELCRYFSIAAYQYHSGFHFTYPFFGFIGPPSSDPETNTIAVEFLFFLMLIATAFIAVGFLYRIAIVVFCLIYTYFFFIDLTFYNNHFYLISILAFLMSLTQLNAQYSIDSLITKKSSSEVPFWQLAIFRLQWTIVYFYAGVAKIQPDWLNGEPVRGIFLERNENVSFIIDIVGLETMTMIVAWGGMMFDLSIAFLLLFKKTRIWALPVFFIFHVSNHFLFEIGIFPWLALASVVLFLDPSTPRKFLNWILAKNKKEEKNKSLLKPNRIQPWLVGILAIHFTIQILLPLRPYFYSQRSDWTQQGYKFAWRMMLNHWDSWLRVTVIEQKSGKAFDWNRHDGITKVQLSRMQFQPRALAQYAAYIREQATLLGIENPQIRMESVVSLNGRPFQFLVNPLVDAGNLTWEEIEDGDWIIPLEESEKIGEYADSQDQKLSRVAAAKLPSQITKAQIKKNN